MNIRILLSFLFTVVFLSFKSSAQVERKSNTFDLINLERHQFKFNLVSPGLSYEIGILKNVTASTSFGLGVATYQEGYSFGFAWHTRMRYYHNLNRRIDLGKNVSGNSGDYLAPARSVFWEPLQISHNLDSAGDFGLAFYGGMYGIQRTYEKGFNFNAEFGVGYYRGDGVLSGYGPLFNFTFGWVATKRKSRKPVFN